MDWKLSKRYPTPEDKEEATSRGRRGNYVGASPTDWKVTGSQRLTYRSESSEPHIKPPNSGDLELGQRAPRAPGIKGQWGLCTGAPGHWGKWRSHS